MSILKQTKENFINKIEAFARTRIIKKLGEQGVNYTNLVPNEFENFLNIEKEILKSNSKTIITDIAIVLMTFVLINI